MIIMHVWASLNASRPLILRGLEVNNQIKPPMTLMRLESMINWYNIKREYFPILLIRLLKNITKDFNIHDCHRIH